MMARIELSTNRGCAPYLSLSAWRPASNPTSLLPHTHHKRLDHSHSIAIRGELSLLDGDFQPVNVISAGCSVLSALAALRIDSPFPTHLASSKTPDTLISTLWHSPTFFKLVTTTRATPTWTWHARRCSQIYSHQTQADGPSPRQTRAEACAIRHGLVDSENRSSSAGSHRM